jgi:predicted dehydrogenase
MNWGIIAPGRIAHKFAQDLAQVADAKLVAVASRNYDRAREFANQYGAAHAFGSYEELAQCDEVDVVYIASPHIGHHPHTLLCLQNKKAVLCEKPFGMDAAQVAEMVATAEQNNVFLMEALWSRFMPTIVKTLEIIESGAIGNIKMVRADFGFLADFDPEKRLFNKELGGGALLDIGIYPLFLSYVVLGIPAHINASAVFSDTGVDELLGAVLTYDNDKMAVLDATFRATTNCEGLIYGDKGSITIHGRWHESKSLTVRYEDGTNETHHFDRTTWGYDYEIEEVHRCLQNNQKQSTLWSLQDSKNLMQLLDNVRSVIGLAY